MNNLVKNQQGSITLMTVFFSATALMLLVFADHVMAIREDVVAQKGTATERAFYAAQSCIEEGLLQLRTDQHYAGTTLAINDGSCEVAPEVQGAANGRLVSEGVFQNTIRTVSSFYADAGPAITRNKTAIYHVFDRSGSMTDDGNGCTLPQFTTSATCTANGGLWGLQPLTTAKSAANSFIDRLDPANDQIGVVTFSTTARHDFLISNNFTGAKNAINQITVDSYTNSGDGLALATTTLVSQPASTIKVEILMTDGVTNRPTDEATGQAYALTKAAEAKAQGIIIFTIGLGTTINENFLRTVASTDATGNPYYFRAPSVQDLDEIYDAIANIIIKYNLDQTGWREE